MTRSWTLSPLVLASALCACLCACGDDGGGEVVDAAADKPDPGETMDYEPGSATYSAVFEEVIIANGCNGGPFCHGGATGGLTMNEKQATYDALVGVQAMGTTLATGEDAGMVRDCVDTGLVRVVPGDPENSLLMQKLLDEQPCGTMMPPTGVLTPEQIEQMRAWISNGAADD